MIGSRIVLALAVVSSSVITAADDPRTVVQNIGFDQNLNQQLPLQLAFTNEDGKAVTLKDYFNDKPVVLVFMYHQCRLLCNVELEGLIKCLRAMSLSPGKDFNLVTVSFDPGDTAQSSSDKKNEYIRLLGRPAAAAGWHFLTGSKQSIAALTSAAGFRYVYDAASKQYMHASGILVLTPAGKTSRYLYGIEYYPRDLNLALVEASENKIGTLSDQVLLYCYRYDPMTGKYGLVILNVLRIAGVMTVLALASYIFLMWRRDRNMAGKHAAPASTVAVQPSADVSNG
jgi:protein SCO1/2